MTLSDALELCVNNYPYNIKSNYKNGYRYNTISIQDIIIRFYNCDECKELSYFYYDLDFGNEFNDTLYFNCSMSIKYLHFSIYNSATLEIILEEDELFNASLMTDYNNVTVQDMKNMIILRDLLYKDSIKAINT